MQGAAALAVREGNHELQLELWLREIAMGGESAAWRERARAQVVRAH